MITATGTPTPPARVNTPRALSPQVSSLLRDCPPVGQRSQAAWSVCLAYVNAGRTLAEWSAAMLDPDNGAGDYVRRRHRKRPSRLLDRSDDSRARLLSHTWERAVRYVAGHPAVGEAQLVRRTVDAIRTDVEAHPELWAGQGGPSERETLHGLLDVAHAAGRLTVDASTRQLADGDRVHVEARAVAGALRRLRANGRYVSRIAEHEGTRAPTWELHLPADAQPSAPDVDDALIPAPYLETCSASSVQRRHPVFATRGLGRYAARLDGLLVAGPSTADALAARSHYALRTVWKHLAALAAIGRATCDDDGLWCHADGDLDQAAESLDVAAAFTERVHRHERERENYTRRVQDLTHRRLLRAERAAVALAAAFAPIADGVWREPHSGVESPAATGARLAA